MKPSLLFALICFPVMLICQSDERLYCGACGQRNALTYAYCSECGHQLDKAALVDRLKIRLAVADSTKQSIMFSPDEIAVLLDAEAERRLTERARQRGEIIRMAPRTSTEKTLDIIAPIVTALAALFLISRTSF